MLKKNILFFQTGYNYPQHKAFPVFGYEISKQERIFKQNHSIIKKKLLLNCEYYPNYLMINDIDYKDYLVTEFITDKIKNRGWISYNEVWCDYQMCDYLNKVWEKNIELKIVDDLNSINKRSMLGFNSNTDNKYQKEYLQKLKNELSKRKKEEKKMLEKKEGAEKRPKIIKHLKNKECSDTIRFVEHQVKYTNNLLDKKNCTLMEQIPNNDKDNIKPYIVNIMFNNSPLLTVEKDVDKKNLIVGIYPVQM